jgi:hypothetical protein
MYSIYSKVPAEQAPVMDAIEWLVKAIERDGDPDGLIRAYLALMYGYLGRYSKMLTTVREAVNVRAENRLFLFSDGRALLLVHGCYADANVHELGHLLGGAVPTNVQAVRVTLQHIDPAAPQLDRRYIEWWVAEKSPDAPALLRDNARLPSLLRVFRDQAHADQKRYKARQYPGPGIEWVDFPEPLDEYATEEELFAHLEARYTFVYFASPDHAPDQTLLGPWANPPQIP